MEIRSILCCGKWNMEVFNLEVSRFLTGFRWKLHEIKSWWGNILISKAWHFKNAFYKLYFCLTLGISLVKIFREIEVFFKSMHQKLILCSSPVQAQIYDIFTEIYPHLFFPLHQPQTKFILNSRLYSEEHRKLKENKFYFEVCFQDSRQVEQKPT